MTKRDKMLDMLREIAADKTGDALRCSVLAHMGADDLTRVWGFIESFRPRGAIEDEGPDFGPCVRGARKR